MWKTSHWGLWVWAVLHQGLLTKVYQRSRQQDVEAEKAEAKDPLRFLRNPVPTSE